MTRFTDNLWRDLVREHGGKLAYARRRAPGRAAILKRPRVIAGSTLALAGGSTAIALALSAAGSTPAFAVNTNANGSVLVTISQQEDINHADAKLTELGLHEQFWVAMGSGPATTRGAVTCRPEPGVSGPPVRVLLDKDGTEVIEPGTTGDNTGVGTWHIRACWTFATSDSGPGTGNTGTGNTDPGAASGTFNPASAVALPVIHRGSIRVVQKGSRRVAVVRK
jgi:hypothetical protein